MFSPSGHQLFPSREAADGGMQTGRLVRSDRRRDEYLPLLLTWQRLSPARGSGRGGVPAGEAAQGRLIMPGGLSELRC